MVKVPLRAPLVVGLKVTVTPHEALAATAEVQLLVCEKSAPVIATLDTVKLLLPVFFTVNVCTGADMPTVVDANVSAAADKLMTGAGTGVGAGVGVGNGVGTGVGTGVGLGAVQLLVGMQGIAAAILATSVLVSVFRNPMPPTLLLMAF